MFRYIIVGIKMEGSQARAFGLNGYIVFSMFIPYVRRVSTSVGIIVLWQIKII